MESIPNMNWHKASIEIRTHGKGLYPFTDKVNIQLRAFNVQEGMCYFFLQHTSASLVISENYDPSAKADLETFMEKIVPEGASWYTHDLEGPDDATSHIRAMLTDVSMTIPIEEGRLCLGTWQGLYLFEHRTRQHQRTVLLRVLDVSVDKPGH
jgi:secondary thiamine-phosphate synthase enzyme